LKTDLPSPQRKHWLALAARMVRLWWSQPERTADLVRDSYDRIAGGYDRAWTGHMRDLSGEMLDRLDPPAGARCIDLGCGTGFVAGELARRTGGPVVGVDASSGMLAVARARHGPSCRFVQADMLALLRSQPTASADVVTSAWGLGYSTPARVLVQIGRVLRPGGRVGIIDNSLTSLAEVLWASVLTFAERPESLRHVTKVRFLPHRHLLAALMRRAGIGVRDCWGGARAYTVPDGHAALERLTATGAAAGFEFAANEADREAVFARFAEILRQRSGNGSGVRVTHRYLAAVGVKPCSR